MSTTNVSPSAQELSNLYSNAYCVVAILALFVYDWLLCLDQEVRFIWNWRSRGFTISSLVYVLSRYPWLIDEILAVMTIYPMSDLSCRANVWSGAIIVIPGLIAFSAFSALRAYALSNRSIWLAAIIILLALPPAVVRAVEQLCVAPINLPSPFNCTGASQVPLILSISAPIITRTSQLVAELLVIGITWWYTYQSYRIRRGVTLGKTISSVLFYNGSMYFLCLATLYIVDIILGISSLPTQVQNIGFLFDFFIDPITSILTCRFMLSLRQFDSTIASTTSSRLGPQLREHMASTVLQFGAQPSDSLPALISAFAHPVHVDTSLFETDLDSRIVDNGSEGREIDDVALALAEELALSRQSTSAKSQMTKLPDAFV